MPLSTAMFTGLSGLVNHNTLLDVTGNNIANVNTTAFKKSNVGFETQVSTTLARGSGPSQTLGGTNPAQVGYGVRLAEVKRDFTSGPLQTTGVASDMAIEGKGLFIVDDAGSPRYTRDGSFSFDRDFNIVTAGGAKLQGFAVDNDFNVIDGLLTDLKVPIGVRNVAEATTEVKLAGNLNAGGDAATQGSIVQSQALFATAAGSGGAVATAATDLASVFDDAGNALFAAGDVITLTGAEKGSATVPDQTFTVGATAPDDGSAFGTTLADLLTFFDDALAIDSATSGGVSVDGAGQIVIEGNSGEANALSLDDVDFVVNAAGTPTNPLDFTETQEANGESTRTAFVTYDSLGNVVNVAVTAVLESKTDAGTQWRFYVESEDDTDLDRHLNTGTVSFGNNGQLLSTADNTITVDRDATGATDPLNFELQFEDPFGSVTSLADGLSQVNAFSQDGSSPGTLEDFSVSEDGTITGIFSNGLLRTLGRVPLANFSNVNGLEDAGGNLYRAGANSGDAVIVQGGTGGTGRIVGGALELSNVDLTEEFINLINASTGFSANSRVITTSQQLIQELLASVR